MGDSNNEWGGLAEFDSEMADTWDRCDPLPEDDEGLNALCAEKHITVNDLVRVGGRVVRSRESGLVLAFAGPKGIKYRDVRTGRRWSYIGSDWGTLKVVKAASPEAPHTVIVSEGETDAARLSALYPTVDVAIQQGGAKRVDDTYAEQVREYERVFVALDTDEAGNQGWGKWRTKVPHAERLVPPGDAQDWCEYDGEAVDLPETQPKLQLKVVNAADLLELSVPDIISWFDDAILPIGGLFLLHGWVKSYKTFLALDMAAAIAQGKDWCLFEPQEEPAKAMVIQYELPWPYYRERVVNIRKQAQDRDLFDENFLTWDPLRRPDLTAGNKDTEDEVLRALDENGVQVLVVDPIRRLVRGATGSEQLWEREAMAALQFFERVQQLGVTVVTSHHDNKSAAKTGGGDPLGITGSGAWAGDADTVVSIGLPHGDSFDTSTRRNLYFTLRNGPPVSARGMELVGEFAKIVPSPAPFGGAEPEDGTDGQPSI